MVDTMYVGMVGRKMKPKKHHKAAWLRIKQTKFPKPPSLKATYMLLNIVNY
jgi:hypothetical protein